MHNLANATIALAVPQDISTEVLIEKYAKGDEICAADVLARVALALAEVEPAKQRKQQAAAFLWAMKHGFIPAGRVASAASAAGAGLQSTLINCFVQPVGDAITHTVDLQARHLQRAGAGGRNDATLWPLEKQAREAQNKRRLGLGDALIMLGVLYDAETGRALAAQNRVRAARRRLWRLGRPGQRARRLPTVRRRPRC